MVVVRLARSGSVHRPFYHVVVADRRSKRDGKFIERLGYLNYFASSKDTFAKINQQRYEYWIGQGAVVRPSVRKIVRRLKHLAATKQPSAEGVSQPSAESQTVSQKAVTPKVDNDASKGTAVTTDDAAKTPGDKSS